MSLYQELSKLIEENLDLKCQVGEEIEGVLFWHGKSHVLWQAVLVVSDDEDGQEFVRLMAIFLNQEEEIRFSNTETISFLLERQRDQIEGGTILFLLEEGDCSISFRRTFYLIEAFDEDGFSEGVQEQLLQEIEVFSREAMMVLDSLWLSVMGELSTSEATTLLCEDPSGVA